MRAILHADMAAFFASVEQHDQPELRGLPLIVGGRGGRGVVAAASYEVRRFGVRSAMPVRRALQLCPHAVCVAPRFARYQQVSRQVFAVFARYTPLIEGLSLDEAYLDVTGSRALHGDALTIAIAIKRQVLAETGLTVSIGVATNKLVAKIASDLDKPDGLTVVTTERVNAVLDPLPVKRLPGLGRKKGDELLAAGLGTLGELRRASDAQLWPLFGRHSARARERAAGIDERPVIAERDGKSLSAEQTFARDISDVTTLRAIILRLADKTAARVRARGALAATVQIKIRQGDFTTHTRQTTLTPPTHDSRTLAAAARKLLLQWLAQHPGARLRLLGVGAGALEAPQQADLFASPALVADGRLDATLDQIRERFGTTAVLRGSNVAGKPPIR
jgi:DNA polymerase-4